LVLDSLLYNALREPQWLNYECEEFRVFYAIPIQDSNSVCVDAPGIGFVTESGSQWLVMEGPDIALAHEALNWSEGERAVGAGAISLIAFLSISSSQLLFNSLPKNIHHSANGTETRTEAAM
jgi:hypothetical protein